MFIVRARNEFTDANDHARYVVNVLINDHAIWNGYVEHDRGKGAEGLLRAIADRVEAERKIS